jgi:hypothetical protein
VPLLLVCLRHRCAGRCVEAGASRVVIAPYFLSRGRHIQEDIPALVAAAQQQFPGIDCSIADPIGEHAAQWLGKGCFGIVLSVAGAALEQHGHAMCWLVWLYSGTNSSQVNGIVQTEDLHGVHLR